MHNDIHWACLPFEQLDLHRLYALMRLRVEVFVVEQNCPYPELDGRDLHPQALHLLGERAGQLVACARLLPPGLGFEGPAIGRVVVAASARGTGLAHLLMAQALAHGQRRWPQQAIFLGAQSHLQGLYAAHGFEVCSAPYLEDGIPHIDMRRNASTSA
ncbi:MAG: GNAT family N-acetyltransferase [Aquimonas sp.]|nr:GNAT family N-acetyltransferase [Aquimonas sp.]